jgi:predicted nucleic acid-binding protein
MFLLDTCLISESVKPHQDEGVLRWLAAQGTGACYISAVTIGELHYGTAAMLAGKRRRHFETWIEGIEEDFAARIVPVDQHVAARWGTLRARTGMPLADGQIAATALTYDFTLVTRNEKDFRVPGLNLVNPWAKP